jgi:AraC family transcriptional regulator, regulatory protein of adaptative response / methylated-DNA-[protein]-cysteine methyltransferase
MKIKTTQTALNGARRYATDQARWTAVAQRNALADGAFVYAVKTTGVYCRPSCGSKLARRENVRFHASAHDAERAGFRPCQRCQPDRPTAFAPHADAITAACRAIESAENPPSLAELSRAAGLSRFYFLRIFAKQTGLTPAAYAAAHRADRARLALRQRPTVTDAIYEAGFNSNGRFYATASRMLGMKPKNYSRGGAGETIRFAIGECSLGSILVATSTKGICAVSLGDDPNRLGRELQDTFPNAKLIGADRNFERLIARVIGLIEAPRIGQSLPLDIRGTAFQRRVWRALSDIHPGSTATYSEIAAIIGAPKSVRAVASACAANKLAVTIPCHRVVRMDGQLSGYRWGVKRKRALLRREADSTPRAV